VAYIGNAIPSPPQVEAYQVVDIWFASLGIRCSNGDKGHLSAPAVVPYKNISDHECDLNTRSLTKHIRGRFIHPVKFFSKFCLGILGALGLLLLSTKRAYVLEKETIFRA
jgi:hypothetical protein